MLCRLEMSLFLEPWDEGWLFTMSDSVARSVDEPGFEGAGLSLVSAYYLA